MLDINIQNLDSEQEAKVKQDLLFIDLISKNAKESNCRVVISGGYAVDGSLGKITRYHNDIDIQIYGQQSDAISVVKHLLDQIMKSNPEFAGYEMEDKADTEFYRNLYVKIGQGIADIYYLHTKTNPFEDEKIILKKDGSLTPAHAYDTIQVELKGVKFEAQNPLTEVVDKIYKREFRGDPKREKHVQDIENLRQIVDLEEIDKKLDAMKANSGKLD